MQNFIRSSSGAEYPARGARVTSSGEIALPPVLLLQTGQPGTPGWVTGAVASKTGGAYQGSGLVIGTVTFSGGAITSIPVTNGGSGYPLTSRLRMNIAGDGSGAAAYAMTNSSGVITSITVTSGGGGYTTVTSATIPVVGVVNVVFDLGPDFDQYSEWDLGFQQNTGSLSRFAVYGSPDGVTTARMLTLLQGTTEAYVEGLGNAGSPARAGRLCGMRYVIVSTYFTLDTSASTTIYLTVRP